LTAPQRLEYISHRKTELDELEKRAGDKLGVGQGIEMAKVKDAKALVTLARSAVLTDADDYLAELKKEAITAILGPRFEEKAPRPGAALGRQDPAAIAPKGQPEGEPRFDQLPPELKAVWEQYRKEFKEWYPVGEKAAEVDHAYDLVTHR